VATYCSECSAELAEGAVCTNCDHGARIASHSSVPPSAGSIAEGGELREATVLFCDLGGYTAWNEEEEPEAVVPTMDRIKLQAIRIFAEHGGVANQFVGDEILGLFGVTASNEDDPCRATSAALELHAYVHEQQVLRPNGERRVLELHTGIETGMIYVRVTDSRGGLFDVTGDTVNTAARVRSLALPGQILIGPVTYERVWMHFDTAALPPTIVRGKAQSLTPHQVLRRVRLSLPFASATGRPDLTTCVGREQELQRLRRAWEGACSGRGGLVTIEGLAGVGKSRLTHELRRHVLGTAGPAGALVLHGRCAAYHVAPYQPLIDALLGAIADDGEGAGIVAQLATLAPLSSQSLDVLAHLLAPGASTIEDPPAEGELRRQAIVEALDELVATSSAERPVLVLLEDFHDADEPSRAALRHIIQHASTRRALFVVNYRPVEGTDPLRLARIEHFELEALDAEAARTMACEVLATHSLSPDLASHIHERTQGNPFFVEEICRSLQEAGALSRRLGMVVPTRSMGMLRAPPGVRSIVRSRVERLPAAHKKALRLASVLSPEFSIEELKTLWINPRPFESALVAEAAWQSVTPPAAADVDDLLLGLESQRLIASTGDARAKTYRFEHAITQEVVYESLPRHGRRWYHGLIAGWMEQQYAPDKLEALYETLAHHFGKSDNTGKALDYAILSGEKAWRSFALEQAGSHYARATALFLQMGPLDVARKRRHIEVSISWARVGLYNPSSDQLNALHTSRHYALELADARGLCLCLNWISWIEYALGNHRMALASSEEFLTTARTLNDSILIAQAHANLGLAQAMSTDYAPALLAIDAATRTRGRSRGSQAYSLGYLAMIRGDQGAFELSFEHLRDAAEMIGPLGRDTLKGPWLIQRGMVEAWQGDWQACLETARHARAVSEHIGGQYIAAMSLTLEGYALGMSAPEQRAVAVERLEEAVSMLEGQGVRLHMSWCCSTLAEVLVAAGEYTRAEQFATAALERAALDDRLGEAAALRVLGTVAQVRDGSVQVATELFQRAEASAQRKSSPREVAITQLCTAECLDRAGEPVRARALLERAHAYFTARAMPWYVARAEQLLQRLLRRVQDPL